MDVFPAGLPKSPAESDGDCRILSCFLPAHVRSELRVWFSIAWPVSVTLACQVAMTVTDVSFLGHIDTDYLAASSLASVWITIITIALWSFGDAIRVLCSQAKGAGNYRLIGVWLQCGIVWITVLCIPVGALFLATGDVLHLVRIKPSLCHLAQKFAYYSLIWLWPRALFNAGNSYLQSQNIVYPQMIASLVFVGVNVGLNYVLVHGGVLGWKGLGFIGSPIATACSQTLLTVSLLVYTVASKSHVATWPGWTRECVSRARSMEYLKQAVPLTVGRLIEESQIQVITVFAGHLGNVQVATHSGMLNVFYWLTTAMWGLMQATTVRVGLHLGNGDIPKAKLSSRISLGMASAIGTVVAIVLVTARKDLGKVYSSNPDVWEETARISYLVGAGYLALTFFFSSMSILEAQARPTVVAVAFVIGAWGISVPLSYVFCFVIHKDLLGLWYGMCCGYLVITAIAGIAVLRSNWPEIMEAALKRSRPKQLDAGNVNISDEEAVTLVNTPDETTPLVSHSPGFE